MTQQGASKLSRSITGPILIGLALVTTLNAWRSMVHYADWWPFLIDELVNTQAAVNFFQTGNYTSSSLSGGFPSWISTGLASTWPSALAWTVGSNLLASRLSLGAAVWILYLLIGWLYLRKQTFSTPLVMFLLAGLWSVSVTDPLSMPNIWLFLINLGELTGVLWVGLGLLWIRTSPYGAALTWGIAIWLIKFIYFPLVFGFGIVWFMLLPEPWPRRLRRGVIFLFWFLVPILLWLTITWVRFDTATVQLWISGVLNFAMHGGHGLDATPKVSGLIARLNSPELEWHTYALVWKVKILVLTLGSVALSLGLLLGKRRLVADRRSRWFMLVTIGCVSAYTVWYFLWHPTMWIRHLQPALYLGLGLYLFWLLQFAHHFKSSIEQRSWVWLNLATLLVGLQTINAWQLPLLQSGTTYARACTKLFSPSCGDYSGLATQIHRTPGSVVLRLGLPLHWPDAFEHFYNRDMEVFIPTECAEQNRTKLAEELRRVTAGHREAWLLRPMPIECDPTGFVPRWLAENAYPAEEFWLQQTNLFTRYLLATEFKAQGAQAGRLGDSISLASWGIDQVTVTPGQGLGVALTWTSAQALTQDYRVFVFLANQSEQVATLHDAVPTMWLRPTSTWQPGELITDHHGLLIPPEASSGEYWLGVGMYDSATGERLPVTAGDGWLNNTVLRLTTVTIRP